MMECFVRIRSTNLRTTCSNLLEAFLEFREVRSGPINLAATCAKPELLVVGFRKWFEPFNDFGLRSLLQRRVAAKAPRKRSDGTKKIKAANYFDGLFIGVLRTRAVTGSYYCVH